MGRARARARARVRARRHRMGLEMVILEQMEQMEQRIHGTNGMEVGVGNSR